MAQLQMVDRGDSYHVIYLGSCMLSHMSTGLGVLQKPLRDLYFKYRQAGGGPAAQERYLRMSARGMTMTYKESATAPPTEMFYAMPSILFWDGVQFCTVKSAADKKLRGAFEPIDNDHSRNKDNLFSVLEKKYHFLQQMTHPPLFTCVLRRTQGVKALDVHAFVCSSDTEALGLVRSLHAVHAHYKTDETVETGVFGYRPFIMPGGPTMGQGPGGGGMNNTGETAGGVGSIGVAAGANNWAPPDGNTGAGGSIGGSAYNLHRQGQGQIMGPGSRSGSNLRPDTGGGGRGGGRSLPGSLQHGHSPQSQHSSYTQQQEDDTPPPRPPARPVSLGKRTGGQQQVQVLPTGGEGLRGPGGDTSGYHHQQHHQIPGRPQSVGRLSAHGLSSSLSSLSHNNQQQQPASSGPASGNFQHPGLSGPASSGRSKVYQLTQEDFRKHNAPLYLHDHEEDDQFPSSNSRRNSRPNADGEKVRSPDDGHVYQYIHHLDDSPEKDQLHFTKQSSSPAQLPSAHHHPEVVLRNNRDWNRQSSAPVQQVQGGTGNNNGSIERESVARSRALVQETLANQHNSISRNLNQLFSQQQQLGSDSNLSSSESPRQHKKTQQQQAESSSGSGKARATIFGASFSQRDSPQSSSTSSQQHRLSQFTRGSGVSGSDQRGGGAGSGHKLGQAYGHNNAPSGGSRGAGSGVGAVPGYTDHQDARHLASSGRNYASDHGGGSHRGSNGSVDVESLRSQVPAPTRHAERMGGTPSRQQANSRSREDLQGSPQSGRSSSHSNPHYQGSPFTSRDSSGTSDTPPSRPVAKVPPHKVTGVKVFPGGTPVAAMGSLKSTNNKSPQEYTHKSPFIETGSGSKAPPKRPTSKYFDEPQYMDEESSSSGSSPAKSPPLSPTSGNWAFGGRSGSGDDSGTGTMDNHGSKSRHQGGANNPNHAGEDGAMNEKLLLSKKKDAEIASVLQNLKFNDPYGGQSQTNTMSPGLPAGNNFEKSLGYFP